MRNGPIGRGRHGSLKPSIVASVAALGILLSAGVAAAQEPPEALLVTNVTVVDAMGVRPDVDVVVRDGQIESVGAELVGGGFAGRRLDGRDRFLIPGLIDAHVHLEGASRRASERTFQWLLEGGVTAVRDMAGDARTLAGLKQAQLTGEMAGPALYYSGLMAGPEFLADPRLQAATKGYESGKAPYMVPVTGETDIPRAVATLEGTGATGVKLYAALTGAQVADITREAHAAGLQVWAHFAVFPAKPLEVILAGVDGVSHAPYVIWQAEAATTDFTLRGRGDFQNIPPDHPELDRALQAMADRGTVLDPTLHVFDRQSDDEVGQRRLAWAGELTRRARGLGVTIAAGTDGAGQPVAGALPNVHREMELLVRWAGLTPLEALTAATDGGARALGLEDHLGTIEAGKAADMVLLSHDPLQDVAHVGRIIHVIQGGRLVR